MLQTQAFCGISSSNVLRHFRLHLRVHKPHLNVTAFGLGIFVLQRCISLVQFSFIAKFKYTLLLTVLIIILFITVCYKLFFCLCCVSGLNLSQYCGLDQSPYALISQVSPAVTRTLYTIRLSRDILYMSISNCCLSYLICTAYCYSMSLRCSKV